jgi:hypothetical protein
VSSKCRSSSGRDDATAPPVKELASTKPARVHAVWQKTGLSKRNRAETRPPAASWKAFYRYGLSEADATVVLDDKEEEAYAVRRNMTSRSMWIGSRRPHCLSHDCSINITATFMCCSSETEPGIVTTYISVAMGTLLCGGQRARDEGMANDRPLV